jgi:hypothetical protein
MLSLQPEICQGKNGDCSKKKDKGSCTNYLQ